jgi:hypothetical protein
MFHSVNSLLASSFLLSVVLQITDVSTETLKSRTYAGGLVIFFCSSAKRNLGNARFDIKGVSKLVVVVLHVDMYVQIFPKREEPSACVHECSGNSHERTANREHFVVGGKP